MNKCIFQWLCVSFLLFQTLEGTTTAEVFRKHLNPIFIETGTFRGEGLDKALQAGFPEVYSIELDVTLYQQCRRKFASRRNVHLFQGDSSSKLALILPHIDEQITFWLDAHFSSGVTAMGTTHTPIIDELHVIANHSIKTHTIMIDDVRLFGTAEFDFVSLEEIVDEILKINPKYSIFFEDGHVQNDVLVAKVL